MEILKFGDIVMGKTHLTEMLKVYGQKQLRSPLPFLILMPLFLPRNTWAPPCPNALLQILQEVQLHPCENLLGIILSHITRSVLKAIHFPGKILQSCVLDRLAPEPINHQGFHRVVRPTIWGTLKIILCLDF